MVERCVQIDEADALVDSLPEQDKEPLLRNIEKRIEEGGMRELEIIAKPPYLASATKNKQTILKKFFFIYRSLLEDKHSIKNIFTQEEAAEKWGIAPAAMLEAINSGKFHKSECRLSGGTYIIRRLAMEREFGNVVQNEDDNELKKSEHRLIALRKESGHSISFIAKEIGVTDMQYIDWEIFSGDMPVNIIAALGSLFKVSPLYLMGMIDERN